MAMMGLRSDKNSPSFFWVALFLSFCKSVKKEGTNKRVRSKVQGVRKKYAQENRSE